MNHENKTLQEVIASLTLTNAISWRKHHYNANFIVTLAAIPAQAKFTARWVRKIEQELFDKLAIHDESLK